MALWLPRYQCVLNAKWSRILIEVACASDADWFTWWTVHVPFGLGPTHLCGGPQLQLAIALCPCMTQVQCTSSAVFVVPAPGLLRQFDVVPTALCNSKRFQQCPPNCQRPFWRRMFGSTCEPITWQWQWLLSGMKTSHSQMVILYWVAGLITALAICGPGRMRSTLLRKYMCLIQNPLQIAGWL